MIPITAPCTAIQVYSFIHVSYYNKYKEVIVTTVNMICFDGVRTVRKTDMTLSMMLLNLLVYLYVFYFMTT